MSLLCDLCFSPLLPEEELTCAECMRDRAYYDALTPEEWMAERDSMARYVDEQDES